MSLRRDAVIVGGGHNGLVAAAILARAGWSVTVLERAGALGGAAVSARPFPGLDARISRYSYLVSLFPPALMRSLGLALRLQPRTVSSYTPHAGGGLLVRAGGPAPSVPWQRFYATIGRLARRVFPTLTEPLRSRAQLRRLLNDEPAWSDLFDAPLSVLLERTFSSDLIRGLVLTDATIGTFAPADDPALRQNRCFLYHVIGGGHGRWEVPIGGMGALSAALARAARAAGAELRTGCEVTAIRTDGAQAEVQTAAGERLSARHVLAGVAPALLARLLGEPLPDPAPEGSQLKLNLLLRRLPALRDGSVDPREGFAGTFHVNEGYGQLQAAYAQAAAGAIPELPPCELYCHTLSDPSILGPELRAAGAQTLTVFALHMPARLFRTNPAGAKRAAVAATLRSLNSTLAEPIEDCLWVAPNGQPCLEALTPVELEAELGMPGGHIFHRDLAWPYAESDAELGRWGTETGHANVWLCGAGARRGGGVSGIPGHNAARAALERG